MQLSNKNKKQEKEKQTSNSSSSSAASASSPSSSKRPPRSATDVITFVDWERVCLFSDELTILHLSGVSKILQEICAREEVWEIRLKKQLQAIDDLSGPKQRNKKVPSERFMHIMDSKTAENFEIIVNREIPFYSPAFKNNKLWLRCVLAAVTPEARGFVDAIRENESDADDDDNDYDGEKNNNNKKKKKKDTSLVGSTFKALTQSEEAEVDLGGGGGNANTTSNDAILVISRTLGRVMRSIPDFFRGLIAGGGGRSRSYVPLAATRPTTDFVFSHRNVDPFFDEQEGERTSSHALADAYHQQQKLKKFQQMQNKKRQVGTTSGGGSEKGDDGDARDVTLRTLSFLMDRATKRITYSNQKKTSERSEASSHVRTFYEAGSQMRNAFMWIAGSGIAYYVLFNVLLGKTGDAPMTIPSNTSSSSSLFGNMLYNSFWSYPGKGQLFESFLGMSSSTAYRVSLGVYLLASFVGFVTSTRQFYARGPTAELFTLLPFEVILRTTSRAAYFLASSLTSRIVFSAVVLVAHIVFGRASENKLVNELPSTMMRAHASIDIEGSVVLYTYWVNFFWHMIPFFRVVLRSWSRYGGLGSGPMIHSFLTIPITLLTGWEMEKLLSEHSSAAFLSSAFWLLNAGMAAGIALRSASRSAAM